MNPHRTHLTHATIHLNTLSTEHPLHTALATALATYTANSNLKATFVRLLPEILKTSASDFGFLAEVVYATPTKPYLHSHAVVDICKSNYTYCCYSYRK